jgi:cold shock CspA family protein
MRQPYVGTINFKRKRYGFITPEDGGIDVYANAKKCPELDATQRGNHVYYDAKWNASKGNYTATSIALVPFPEAPTHMWQQSGAVEHALWQPYIGTIKKIYTNRGYGWITPDDGGDNVYANLRKFPQLGATRTGERVYYDAKWNEGKSNYTATYLALAWSPEAPEGTEMGRVTSDSKR